MPKRNQFYGKRKNSRRMARKSNKKVKKLSKPMRKAVAGVVNRMQETKNVVYTAAPNISAYTTTNGFTGFIPISPYGGYLSIFQGTGQGERVGNSIRIVKALLKFIIVPLGFGATNNPSPQPQDVIVRLFSSKLNSPTFITAVPNYFELGNSSLTPDGTLRDCIRTVNTDAYTEYFKRVYKVGNAINQGTGAVAAQAQFANNDYKLNQIGYIDYTKYLPTIVKFNDNTANASTRLLELFVEAVNSDGTAQIAASLAVSFQYSMCIWFKDA